MASNSFVELLRHTITASRPQRQQQPVRRAAPLTFTQDMGWKCQSGEGGRLEYTGYFQACSLRFRGEIYHEPDNSLYFYIHQPPIGLLQHTDYAGCFHPRDYGWYLISFKPYAKPANVDSGIYSIQQALGHLLDPGVTAVSSSQGSTASGEGVFCHRHQAWQADHRANADHSRLRRAQQNARRSASCFCP
jgi:hypothetical protein